MHTGHKKGYFWYLSGILVIQLIVWPNKYQKMWGQVRNSNSDVILWHLLTRMHGCYDFKNSSHDLWQHWVNLFNCCAKLCYSWDKNLISLKNHLCLTLVNKPLCVMFHVSFIVDNLPYLLKNKSDQVIAFFTSSTVNFFLHWHTILSAVPLKSSQSC